MTKKLHTPAAMANASPLLIIKPALVAQPSRLCPHLALRPLFRYVLATLNQPEPLRSTLLTPCVDLMVRSFVTNNLKLVAEPRTELPAAVEKALGFIRDMAQRDPAPAVTLGELARAAHVSPEHLCRLFRRNLNAGPLECLRHARLERAAVLVGRAI